MATHVEVDAIVSSEAYFLLGGMIALGGAVVLLRRSARRRLDHLYFCHFGHLGPPRWDALSLELGTRIFSSQDCDFVAAETAADFQRRFREERTVLALAWLKQLGGEINHLMRGHLKAARTAPDIRSADELRLGIEYLLFQIANASLRCMVWMYGPTAAGKLVRYSIRLAVELKDLTQDIAPATSVQVEIVRNEPESWAKS